MEGKGANPFLFTEEEEESPHSTTMASNPFLVGGDDDDSNEYGDNPFLAQAQNVPTTTATTNPFAFEPEPELIEEDIVDVNPNPSSTCQDFFTSSSATTQDFFSNDEAISSTTTNQCGDFFSSSNNAANTTASQDFFTATTATTTAGQDLFPSSNVLINISASPVQKPTNLELTYSYQDAAVPSRPPPPPRPPPSKETQDLLQTVMGAMETTSSHLLDRIPPTRTPSPVSMRDLRTPSPVSDDLLDVTETEIEEEVKVAPPPVVPQPVLPPVVPMRPPAPPVRPPRPLPPQKPLPPVLPPVVPPVVQTDEMMDMFGVTPAQKPLASKADILNLYNAAPKQVDLLLDNFEIEDNNNQEIAFVSPNDLQVDTSDTSKGSVSSVTFNPFAAQPVVEAKDEVFIEADVNFVEDEVKSNEIMNGFGVSDDFDAFSEKFESVKEEAKVDAFAGADDAWGNAFTATVDDGGGGFGNEDGFDAFLALQEAPPPIVPQSTPSRVSKAGSQESDEDKDFSVVIRPKVDFEMDTGVLPVLAPPPVPTSIAFANDSLRFNPFDQQAEFGTATVLGREEDEVPIGQLERTDSQETPPTPLFDDDVSQPLEPFPRINYPGEGWEMQLRQPNKKKITGQRFWKKIFVRLVYQPDCVLLQLYNQQADKDPFQELPLQPCYSVSDIGAQQYDQFGKIFTVKLQYIFYKERPGVRPGQVKKAERITNKLSQFAAYAIQGDYQGCKEFGSDLKKLGLPVEHAPQVSQLMKIGSLSFEDLKQFSMCIEEALFKLQAHRDRALHYKMEEVQITAVDELYVEQDAEGHIERQIARVRLFFLGFLTGMPDIELGVNDMRRQGKEVVGRHDIIPVVTEEWIRLEAIEFHSCIQQDEYEKTHIIKFKPPDACYIELMRFRVRPPKNRELPLQLKAQICVMGTKVEMRADVLVPGFASRKLGQIPCEDVMIRFPIPECWIYLFRVEKHFRYGSVKSAHRRTGKIKGIERILGTVETLHENLIEVTSGQAKYEHQHRAIVWRCPRLPKEGQGAYTTHNMVCRIALTSYDQMPDKLAEYCYVEFTMPATQVSHTTCRSVSLQNSDSDDPPEKYVRYLARHEYKVGIEHTEGEAPNAYSSATYTTTNKPAPPPVPEEKPAPVPEESSSDSD